MADAGWQLEQEPSGAGAIGAIAPLPSKCATAPARHACQSSAGQRLASPGVKALYSNHACGDPSPLCSSLRA